MGTGAVDAAAGAESDPVEDARAVVALPGVIDLLEHRERKAALEVVDDVDVFAQYYAEHPDTGGLEVFDD